MKQEVRVRLDVSLTVDAKHSDAKVRDIVESGVRNAWPNNYKHIHELRYAEERHIYHGKHIRWQTIFANPRRQLRRDRCVEPIYESVNK